MKAMPDGENIIIALEGSVTSANAPQVEAGIRAVLRQYPGHIPEFDFGALRLISSVGLRMLLKFEKEAGRQLCIRNVSSDVYEVLEASGFTTIFQVRRKLRELSIEGGEVTGKGAIGSVYRIDADPIVKVYPGKEFLPMIENEQKMARQAFIRGIPTAIPFDIVRIGDTYGSVFEMVKARACNELLRDDPGQLGAFIRMYAALIRQLHGIEVGADEFPDVRETYLSYVRQLSGHLTAEAVQALDALLRIPAPRLSIIHGDIHVKNIMASGGELLLIDMDTLSVGDPIFDFAGLYVTYCAFSEDDPDDIRAFFGLDAEVCRQLYQRTLEAYLGQPDETVLDQARERIRLLGSLRYLYLLAIKHQGRKDLAAARIRRTEETIDTLAPRVSALALTN